MSAALAGAGVGLGLGATYLAAGMSGHVAERAESVRLTQAAVDGFATSYLEARGRGLRAGMALYGPGGAADAQEAADRQDASPRRSELECMTDAVYYEARGESVRGQAAVAEVVMNRVKHPAFPKTVCGVVFQGAGHAGCQFSFACDGSMRRGREADAWDEARRVAARVLAGNVLVNVGAATHFHTVDVSPAWAPQMLRVAQVGVHVFYKFAPYRLHTAPDATLQQAVLTSAPAPKASDIRLEPALVEKAVETSLQPASPPPPATKKVAPLPAPKPTEAALLATPQTILSGAS